MNKIHPTAIIDRGAELAGGVEIGAYSIIGGDVRIGRGSVIGPHVVIKGNTTIGERNRIFQFASVGEINQDKKYRGENTRLVIGDDNVVRENVTLQIGTVTGQSETTIGNRNLIMVSSHVAHDCLIGDDCILANCATLAGHIRIGNGAIIGGLVGIHQFCRVGEMAIIGGCSKVVQDIPPFMMADGHPARVRGINVEGLRRRKVDREVINSVKESFKALFRSEMNISQAVAWCRERFPGSEYVSAIVSFVEGSERGIGR